MDNKHVVIAAATRTPIGAFQGVLSPASRAATRRRRHQGRARGRGRSGRRRPGSHHGLRVARGPGAGARRARLRSAPSMPTGVPTTTINKMCGSGMKAIMMAADQIRAGDVSSSRWPAASSP